MVSIIIATFNAANVLKAALDSVLTQTYQHWECIIVDGVSKDATLTIVEEYERLDKRFWHISEPDKGIYDAFNKGWKNANGKWILYLGADDFLEKDGLTTLVGNSNENIDIIYGDIILISPRGNKWTKRIASDCSCLKWHMCCSHQSVLMRKSCLKQLAGFNLNYSILGDFDLLQRAYLEGFKFKRIDSTIAYFNTGGISSDSLKLEFERYRILKNNHSTRYPLIICTCLTIKKILVILKHKLGKYR